MLNGRMSLLLGYIILQGGMDWGYLAGRVTKKLGREHVQGKEGTGGGEGWVAREKCWGKKEELSGKWQTERRREVAQKKIKEDIGGEERDN